MMLADLNINENKLVNATFINGNADINIIPGNNFNIVVPTGYINCGTPLQIGLSASGPNGNNGIIFNYNDSSGEFCSIMSSDIQAVFIDSRYANGGGAPTEPLQ